MKFMNAIFAGLLSIALINCSSSKKMETPPAVVAPSAPTTPAPLAKEEKTGEASKELNELKQTLKQAEAIVKKDSATAPASEHSHDSRKVGDVPAEKALGWLKNGNTRYLKGFLRKDGSGKKDIERVSTGQSPHTIVFSCSDSRVPPEVVFDQKLGEIFVVRTAGQTIDNSVLASIEYAVQHLGVNLILVMGHSSCGAVKTAFEAEPNGDVGSPYLNALVAEVRPRIAQDIARGPASEGHVTEGWDNARGVAQKLMEKSKIIRDAAKSGSLRVETALYHLRSGQVEWNQ